MFSVFIKKLNVFFLFFILSHAIIFPRSFYRSVDEKESLIETSWVGNNKKYLLRSDYLEESAIFNLFDRKYLIKNSLPEGKIPFRGNKKKSVSSKLLGKLIDDLISKLREKAWNKKERKKEKNFKVLKSSNFDFQNAIGSLILKFKKYPFVVKLFMENPKSFARIGSKDFLQRCTFYMGGGSSRYLLGFTRIKNLNYVKSYVSKHKRWAKIVDFPRKWFWLSKHTKWFKVSGKKVSGKTYRETILPSIYAIISDSIEIDKKFTLSKDEDRHMAMSLAMELDDFLDPNISNFVVEKGTGKILLIDTEHFASTLGLREPVGYYCYQNWITPLALKCIRDICFRSKKHRLKIRNGTISPIIFCKECYQ